MLASLTDELRDQTDLPQVSLPWANRPWESRQRVDLQMVDRHQTAKVDHLPMVKADLPTVDLPTVDPQMVDLRPMVLHQEWMTSICPRPHRENGRRETDRRGKMDSQGIKRTAATRVQPKGPRLPSRWI